MRAQFIGATLGVALSPVVAVAQNVSTLGEWCNETGDTVLYLAADSLGIGEHRVCEWQDLPEKTRKISSDVTCRQFAFDGEKHVVIDEQKYKFSANLKDDDHLFATFDDGDEVFSYKYIRCDW